MMNRSRERTEANLADRPAEGDRHEVAAVDPHRAAREVVGAASRTSRASSSPSPGTATPALSSERSVASPSASESTGVTRTVRSSSPELRRSNRSPTSSASGSCTHSEDAPTTSTSARMSSGSPVTSSELHPATAQRTAAAASPAAR